MGESVARRRKYRKPPVYEALCELFFSDSTWDDTIPGRFYERVKGSFPIKEQKEAFQAEVAFSRAGEASAGVRKMPPRMQFCTSSRDRIVQVGQDLLVVNQLQPYPHFEVWEPVIYSMLDVYRDLAQPKAIARLGVRYLNRIVVPAPRIRMEDYFTIYPQLPMELGDTHGPFMLRLEVPDKRPDSAIFITFASTPSEGPDETAHLLDIYCVRGAGVPGGSEQVREVVREAHEAVEIAFESSITERLRRLFEPED